MAPDTAILGSLSLCGLVIGTYALSRSTGSSFAFDKPIHTSVVLLASSAITLIVFGRSLSRALGQNEQSYTAVPLSEVGRSHASRDSSPAFDNSKRPPSLAKLRLCFFVLICAICVRVAIVRHMLDNMQCTILSWEPLIPLAFALWDYKTTHRHKQAHYEDDPTSSVDDAMEAYAAQSPYRFICATALVAIGSMIALSSSSGHPSTYICASSLNNHWIVPLIQHMGTVADVAILYCIAQLLESQDHRGARGASTRFTSVGWAILFSCAVLFIYGVLYTTFMAHIIDRKRILEIPSVYVWSLIRLNALACMTVFCACIAISSVGLTTTSVLTTFISILTTSTAYAWNNTRAFPPTSPGHLLLGVSLLVLGFALYVHLQTLSDEKTPAVNGLFSNKVPGWFYMVVLILFFLHTALWMSTYTSVTYHPIDLLIYDAQTAHNAYVNQTLKSKTLGEAAERYREKYNRHPPPGFDHWYTYATERNSSIIDEFDSIYNDLLPFGALSPQEIRDRTWQMMSNPWHDASGLSIRDGKVAASPNVMPTHYWMLEGLMSMIGNFAEWLPDMDLAFNVNDECRIAVPLEDIEHMRKLARDADSTQAKVGNSFSSNRAEQWTPLPEEPNTDRFLREMSWQKTFDEFGATACPPSSPARSQRVLDVGRLCTSCTRPQSMGAFLANWTLANDICHQPDLAHQHGFYVAPSAFKASHQLYPIFSQSKVPGFNDILYPSAWNYIDKAEYAPTDTHPDPPFALKNATLFWRGATSEGFSSGNEQWKGMARQRFVHLTTPSSTSPPYPLLLPLASNPDKLAYEQVSTADLTALFHPSIHITSTIARCGGKDCPQQASSLAPLADPTDFQAHWRHKFLLDLDGAGFSGRFLPFLHSRSLPFKAALFREWWDDRVTPWLHFVPLDLRGQGLWATLAYFVGVEGVVNGRVVGVQGREVAAERLASQGREWAGKVLRKEDMEIYFFRLLLEWGRLTDDRREEIGFDGGGDVG